jgi:hypothetical protein
MANFFILNLAICGFNSDSTIQMDMYRPFMGDLNTIDTFIKKNKKLLEYKDHKFSNMISLYLTYYTGEDKFSRNNKKVIDNIFTSFIKEIEKSKNNENYFIIFIHSHAGGSYKDDKYSVQIDNSGCDICDLLTGTELLKYIAPILTHSNCYLILNTCFSDTNNIFNLTSQFSNKQELDFKDVEELNAIDSDKFLKVIGMSSNLVQANDYSENTYGIRILKSLFEMGIDLEDNTIFNLLSNIARDSGLTYFKPNMVSVYDTQNKNKGKGVKMNLTPIINGIKDNFPKEDK